MHRKLVFISVFRRVGKMAESEYQFALHPSAWNNSAPTGQIFIKLYI